MTAKPKAPKKRRRVADDAEFELRTHLPKTMNPATKKAEHLTPYLKSFLSEDGKRIIRGSELKYTACSTNKWSAPEGETA